MGMAASLAYEVDKLMDKHRPGPGAPYDMDYHAGRSVMLTKLLQALELDYACGNYSREHYMMLRSKLEKLTAEAKAYCKLGSKESKKEPVNVKCLTVTV